MPCGPRIVFCRWRRSRAQSRCYAASVLFLDSLTAGRRRVGGRRSALALFVGVLQRIFDAQDIEEGVGQPPALAVEPAYRPALGADGVADFLTHVLVLGGANLKRGDAVVRGK